MDKKTDFSSEKLSRPIEHLNLNRRAYHVLRREKIYTIAEIIIHGEKNILRFKNMGPLLVDHIFSEVSVYLDIPKEVLLGKDIKLIRILEKEKSNNQFYSSKGETPLPKQNLGEILESIHINERGWYIVNLRANNLLTLQQIANAIGGVTRERVRQIIEYVPGKVRRNLYQLAVFLDYFEEKAKKISKKLQDDHIDLKTLVVELKQDITNSNLLVTDDDAEKLITLVRILIIHNKSSVSEIVETRWKALTFLCCLVDPPIQKHEKVYQFVDKREKKLKRLSYKELTYLVLEKEKKPMHWKDIAEQAYKLNNSDSFDARGIYRVLLEHEEVFVRVGQGTYELLEWGNKTVDTYTDIIASILKQEKRAIPIDVIFAKVSAIRPVKRSSIIMYLSMHPRFYKSINDTYGLRGWLPPREKQTLRTPEWLIEDSKSLERVERAEQKGYNIEKMIADDMLG